MCRVQISLKEAQLLFVWVSKKIDLEVDIKTIEF